MKTSFNLLKPQRAPETFWEKFYLYALFICRYIIIGVLLVVIVAFFYRLLTDRRLKDIKEEVENKSAKLALYKDEEIKINRLHSKLNTFSELSNKRGKTNAVIRDLIELIPDSVDKLEIMISEDRLSIKGELNEEDLTTFEKDFKQSDSFRNVVLKVRSKTGEDISATDNITFEFQAEIVRKYPVNPNAL